MISSLERRHVLVRDPTVAGWEYGMLRALEDEIVRQTGAVVVDLTIPAWKRAVLKRVAGGTRWSAPLRRALPKTTLTIPQGVSVLWTVMMGPHEILLDLFRGWKDPHRTTIAYLFDTLPAQMMFVRHMLRGVCDVCLTSFNDAVPLLRQVTGERWSHVNQAVPLHEFPVVPPDKKVIHFAAYGRRHAKAHAAATLFCRQRGLYYDFSTHYSKQMWVTNEELLRNYAWHLSQSQFVFSWPVEMTNPDRAGGLHPITCRWFEAAAAGAVVVGRAPDNPHFGEVFGDGFVEPLDVSGSIDSVVAQLEQLWNRRHDLLERAASRRETMGLSLDWSSRVRAMLEIANDHRSRGNSDR